MVCAHCDRITANCLIFAQQMGVFALITIRFVQIFIFSTHTLFKSRITGGQYFFIASNRARPLVFAAGRNRRDWHEYEFVWSCWALADG